MTPRPKLLDLFCCGGGAARGYWLAGFDVTGVDIIDRSATYPYRFIQADALAFLEGRLSFREFDAIHASPPCQTHSRAKHLRDAQGGVVSSVDLVAQTRESLIASGLPYVIENVPGAPLVNPATVCGSSFGLMVQRHRIFESNVLISGTECAHKAMKAKVAPEWWPRGVYHVMNDHVPSGGRTARTLEEAQEAMGIDWLAWSELKEALPPAYTEHVGLQLIVQLGRVVSSYGEPKTESEG